MVFDFIQENNQEEICKMCEYHILEQSSISQFFQCEGRWCDEANEMFYEEYPEKASEFPPFIYIPSQAIIEAEAKLQRRYDQFYSDVMTNFQVMRFNHTFNMLEIKFNKFYENK